MQQEAIVEKQHHRSISRKNLASVVGRFKDGEVNHGQAGQDLLKYHSVKKAVSKWMHLRRTKRDIGQFLKRFEVLNLKELFEDGIGGKKGQKLSALTGILDEDIDGSVLDSKHTDDEAKQRIYLKSKELLNYFITLARSKDKDKTVDLDFVESLLVDGADPNKGDKYGQTVLHEVARVWHPDVAQFFIEHGSFILLLIFRFRLVTSLLFLNSSTI